MPVKNTIHKLKLLLVLQSNHNTVLHIAVAIKMTVNAQMLNPEVQISVPARFLTVDCTKMIKKKKKMFSADRYHLMQFPGKPTYSC